MNSPPALPVGPLYRCDARHPALSVDDGAVVCPTDLPMADRLGEYLRDHNCSLWPAKDVSFIRPLAAEHGASRFVLPVESRGESGWLSCAKLTLLNPHLRRPVRVVLVSREVTLEAEAHALSVGAAALLPVTASARAVAEALFGAPLPSCN